MASAPQRLQSQMLDALSCIICFHTYDMEDRLPKVFPCLHTVCLECAHELCQEVYESTFPCPTCRQLVPIPSQGASGLPTNLDVRNIVEIMQKTTTASISEQDCSKHPSKSISHVCLTCEVGLCSRCVVSSVMKEHSSHKVFEIEDAFQNIKETIDALAEKGTEVCRLLQSECQAIQEKRTLIECSTSDLIAAHSSKNIGVFGMRDKLSTLLNTASNHGEQNPGATTREIGPDRNCTDVTSQRALDSLVTGATKFENSERSNALESICCQKLAAVTVLIDLLRMDLHHAGLVDTLHKLCQLCYESEPCCHRVVVLGGVDLLVSCFESSKANETSRSWAVANYAKLAVFPSLHMNVMCTRGVNMLVHAIQNFTIESNLPVNACKALSFLLCNPNITWPPNCLSRDEVSALVVDTCKRFPLTLQVHKGQSLRLHIYLLSQQVSEAAKYWPIHALHLFIHQNPDHYCPIFVRNGVVPALKQQTHGHAYIQDQSKLILKKFDEHSQTAREENGLNMADFEEEKRPRSINSSTPSAPPPNYSPYPSGDEQGQKVVTGPVMAVEELPSLNPPSSYEGIPMVSCKVCQSMVNIEGKTHDHIIKCTVCNEATPINAAPPGKKYVRCPCNCLLICKGTSQRIKCARPSCKLVTQLGSSQC